MKQIELGCGAILRETKKEENDGNLLHDGYIYLTLEKGNGCMRTKNWREASYTDIWASEAQFILHRSSLPGLLKAINELMAEDIAKQDQE